MYSIYSSIHQSINQLVSVLKYALWSIIYYALFIIHCVLCLLSIDNYVVSFGIYYIYCWPIRIFINYHLSLYSIILVPYLYLMSADSFIFICRAPCQDFCSKLWRKALPKDVRWGKDVASPLQGGRRPAKRSSVLRLNLSLEDTSIGQNWTAWRMTKMEQTCFVLHLKALSLLTLKRSNCHSVTPTPLVLKCKNRLATLNAYPSDFQASKLRSTPWGISPRCPSWKRCGMKRGRLDCAKGIPGPLAWLVIASKGLGKGWCSMDSMSVEWPLYKENDWRNGLRSIVKLQPSCMTLGKLKPADRNCEVTFGLEAGCPTLCWSLVYGTGCWAGGQVQRKAYVTLIHINH